MKWLKCNFLSVILGLFLLSLTALVIVFSINLEGKHISVPNIMDIDISVFVQILSNIISPIITLVSVFLLFLTLKQQVRQFAWQHERDLQSNVLDNLWHTSEIIQKKMSRLKEPIITVNDLKVEIKEVCGDNIFSSILEESKWILSFLENEYMYYDKQVLESNSTAIHAYDNGQEINIDRKKLKDEYVAMQLSKELSNCIDKRKHEKFQRSDTEGQLRILAEIMLARHRSSVLSLVTFLGFIMGNALDYTRCSKMGEKDVNMFVHKVVNGIRMQLSDAEMAVFFYMCFYDKEYMTHFVKHKMFELVNPSTLLHKNHCEKLKEINHK